MKSILFALLTTLCLNATACEKPYRMEVGAFFDSSSVIAFWGAFAQEVSNLTKCQTNIYPAHSYKQHILNTLNTKGDIFIVPTYYTPVLAQYGLKRVLTTHSLTKSYLVTKKQYDPNNLRTLRSTNIQLPSQYSGAYILMKNKLAKLGLFNSVTFKFGSSFQANAMSVIRGNMDAAVILSPAFDPLPESIKSKVKYSTIYEATDTGSIMVKSDAPKSLTKAIIQAKDKIKVAKWVEAQTPSNHPELTQSFQIQVNQLIKELAENNQTNK